MHIIIIRRILMGQGEISFLEEIEWDFEKKKMRKRF